MALDYGRAMRGEIIGSKRSIPGLAQSTQSCTMPVDSGSLGPCCRARCQIQLIAAIKKVGAEKRHDPGLVPEPLESQHRQMPPCRVPTDDERRGKFGLTRGDKPASRREGIVGARREWMFRREPIRGATTETPASRHNFHRKGR